MYTPTSCIIAKVLFCLIHCDCVQRTLGFIKSLFVTHHSSRGVLKTIVFWKFVIHVHDQCKWLIQQMHHVRDTLILLEPQIIKDLVDCHFYLNQDTLVHRLFWQCLCIYMTTLLKTYSTSNTRNTIEMFWKFFECSNVHSVRENEKQMFIVTKNCFLKFVCIGSYSLAPF